MLKLMLRRDDEFKESERAIDKPACGRQAPSGSDRRRRGSDFGPAHQQPEPAGKVAQP